MNRILQQFCLLCCAIFSLAYPSSSIAQSCKGAFPNLVTDLCWDCVFPIKLGGGLLEFGLSSADYDSGANPSPVCVCLNNITVGTAASFWEPKYMVDVTNVPGCMPLLGGAQIEPPYNAEEYGTIGSITRFVGGKSMYSFMQANLYINPVMTAMGLLREDPCLDDRNFDTPYITWADPTWNDEILSLILTPYVYPFASVFEIASETPDAIAATIGFGIPQLFWTAGSWGPMYPLTGVVDGAKSPEHVSHLVATRIFAKLHAAGTMASTAGDEALKSCGSFGIPQIIMDKRQYKMNRTYPFADATCTPIGRPLQFQEIGAARPQDKDYGYFFFQKKDCCTPFRAVP